MYIESHHVTNAFVLASLVVYPFCASASFIQNWETQIVLPSRQYTGFDNESVMVGEDETFYSSGLSATSARALQQKMARKKARQEALAKELKLKTGV